MFTIKNKARLLQPVDFEGLRSGVMLASDIDAVMEYGDRLFIFVELKRPGTGMPTGQRIMYERMSRAISESPKREAYTILAENNEDDTEKAVDLAHCNVTAFFDGTQKKWLTPTHNINVLLLRNELYELCFSKQI